jgi:hypothetical protein
MDLKVLTKFTLIVKDTNVNISTLILEGYDLIDMSINCHFASKLRNPK